MEGRMVGMAWELAGTAHPTSQWYKGVGGNASRERAAGKQGPHEVPGFLLSKILK